MIMDEYDKKRQLNGVGYSSFGKKANIILLHGYGCQKIDRFKNVQVFRAVIFHLGAILKPESQCEKLSQERKKWQRAFHI